MITWVVPFISPVSVYRCSVSVDILGAVLVSIQCFYLRQYFGSRSGLTMPLSRHGVGTYSETSSHTPCRGTFGHSCLSSFTEPLWTDPGIKSGISVRELISTQKKKKNAGGKWTVEQSPKILPSEAKATTILECCTYPLMYLNWYCISIVSDTQWLYIIICQYRLVCCTYQCT